MRLHHWFDRKKAFPDLLDYAAAVDSGIVESKDGGLMAGWYFIHPDQSSLPDETLNAISWRVNEFLKLLGGGWSLHVNAMRKQGGEYPDSSWTHFPDPVTQAIDDERAGQYGGTTGHYSTRHAAVLHWFPPARAATRMEQLMYRGAKTDAQTIADKTLAEFKAKVVEFADAMRDLAAIIPMEAYTSMLQSGEQVHRDGLLDHLQECITGEDHPVNLSPELPFLDSVLGGYDFIAGLEPVLDSRHIGVIGFLGYPQSTYPAILNALDTAPHEFRWSTRFMYLDDAAAKKQLSSWRRKWQQKVRSFRDQLFNSSSGMVNQHAAEMVAETEAAMTAMASGEVKYGYYTTVIVLRNPDREMLNKACREIIRIIRPLGFAARIETVNVVEGYIGSLPGNLHANVRMPPAQTINLAHFLPLSTVWTGHVQAPCGMYPKGSPALLYADTVGYTAFRLNLHVSDVGHTLIIGPTGTGKSTLLAFIAAQFRKYAGASIYAFDQGYSMYCLCLGAGGQHHDVGGPNDLMLCPLGSLLPDDQPFAEAWITTCCELQRGSPLSPANKANLHETMTHFAATDSDKSLTAFVSQVQDEEIRVAMTHYTSQGGMGHLLDGQAETMTLSPFTCFELENLIDLSDSDKLPVLLYLFRRIEKALTGAPSIILLDEAWIMLAHPVFREKIREWLKVLRKQNCAVIMATQSLSDASNSGLLDVILESTATRIFLANPAATSEASRPYYTALNLNANEINLIATATPKRQYYGTSVEGSRLFDLKLGPVALAFTGQSGPQAKARVDRCRARYGEQWAQYWPGEALR